MTIRAVVDVNVLVSALIGPLGFSRRVVTSWEQGRFELITAERIIAEVAEKLSLPRIRKWLPDPDANRQWIMQLLQTQARIIVVSPHGCQVVTGDPEDDYVLATARLGEADYLVTGDRTLLGLEKWAEAKVARPREFITILESSSL